MTTLEEPCPGNERGAHIIPIGMWECRFCGAEKEGETFYQGGLRPGDEGGKYFINKDGCTRIGDIPEDVRRYNQRLWRELVSK